MYLKILRRMPVACWGQLVLGLTDQGAQLLAIGLRVLDDERSRSSSSPAIRRSRQRSRLWKRSLYWRWSIELIEQGQNGVSVLIAHQLADELTGGVYARCAVCLGASARARRSSSVNGSFASKSA
jgi:hypothetical protein